MGEGGRPAPQMDREQLLRHAMTELEERLLRDGYVPEQIDEQGSRGWHIPSVPLSAEPLTRPVASTIAGLIAFIVAILALVILLRGWPQG